MLEGITDTIVSEPLLIAAAVPLLVGLLVAAAIRILTGKRQGSYAMLGALGAFLLVYLLVEGVPPILAVSAKQKLFWLAVAGGIAGTALEAAGRAGAIERALLVLLPAVGILWLGERQWLRGPETGFAVLSVLVWFAGAAILLRMRATNMTGRGFAGGVQLVVASIALSAIALLGASASLATLAGALAAGLGGVLLVDYAVHLFNNEPSGLGSVGRLGLFSTFVFLAVTMVLFADGVSVVAVALLTLVFLSGRIPLRLDPGRPVVRRLVEPVWFAVLAVIPAAVAVAIAFLQADTGDYP